MENYTNGTISKQLPLEAQEKFTEGIYLILSKWSALQLAVENEWGGGNSRRIADQLGSDIFSWFTQTREPLYVDDLENMLDEAMLSLNTMAEDGSVEEVAEKLMDMHEECLEGSFKSIENLRDAPTVACSSFRQAVSEDDDDDDHHSMGTDVSQSMMLNVRGSQLNWNSDAMAVEELKCKGAAESDDGWEVVTSRRNKGRRN